MDFDDAVLEKQKLSNLFTLFITKPVASGVEDIMTGLPAEYDSSGPIAGLEPGIAQELLPGEDVRFSEPPGVGADYIDFMRMQNLGVAAGVGLPYELMSGDLKDVSDRSLRIGVNEFRRGAEARQWHTLVPRFLKPIRDAWCQQAALSGALTGTEATEAKAVTWAFPAWAYMHPTQDVERAKLEVDAGFRSRASVIAEMGYDPAAVDQERADDAARAAGLGLLSEADAAAKAELARVERTAKLANMVRAATRAEYDR